MKRLLAAAMILCLLGFQLCGCGGGVKPGGEEAKVPEEPKAPEVVKIGHAVALTGDASIWGQSESNALKMWVAKVNSQGGIDGKKIELVTYDTRADSVEAVNVAKRMIEQDKVVAIIGAAQSGVTIAMTAVTEPAKIPLIGTTATNPEVTVKDGVVRPHTFRVCFIDPFQGTVAAQFASTELGAKTAAVLYDVGSDYSSWLAQYFIEAFEKIGGTIVGKEAFRTGELDYRAMLGKLKEQNPDVMFIPTAQKEAALAMKQARDLGYEGKFLGGDNWKRHRGGRLGGRRVFREPCLSGGSGYPGLHSRVQGEVRERPGAAQPRHGDRRPHSPGGGHQKSRLDGRRRHRQGHRGDQRPSGTYGQDHL